MKRFALILCSIIVTLATNAATYTVGQIPNVQATDSTQYVSNPDNILSATTVRNLNAQLRELRHSTTAEAVVVVVDNIEGGDIDNFATELFNLWKPGKSDLDNGLIILVAKDLRRAVIRPGYGLEGVLPDITCGRILREQMFPAFRQNDYDNGIIAAVGTISAILHDPDNAAYIMSSEQDVNTANDDSDYFATYFKLALLIAIAMLIYLIYRLYQSRKQDYHDRYVNLEPLKSPYLVLTFTGVGIPVIASLPLILLLQYWRNSPRKCDNCGSKMKKLDEQTDNFYLAPGQDIEEQLGSVDYDVWQCPNCGEIDIEPYINHASAYKPCPNCGVRAYALRNQRTLVHASNRNEGIGVKQYHCTACGHNHDEKFTISRNGDTDATFAGILIGAALGHGARGGGSGFGGGSFGGGGFGGGMTGGGGASGGW